MVGHYFIFIHSYEYEGSIALDADKEGQLETGQLSLRLFSFWQMNFMVFMEMPGGFRKCLRINHLVRNLISSGNWI